MLGRRCVGARDAALDAALSLHCDAALSRRCGMGCCVVVLDAALSLRCRCVVLLRCRCVVAALSCFVVAALPDELIRFLTSGGRCVAA